MNISSIIGFNKEIFKQSIYKGADGVIYTEKNEPSIIKYLKVIDNSTPNYYTLYGNSQYNSFECRDDMSCIIHTDGGGDDVYQREYLDGKNLYIKDFDKDYDQIILIDKPIVWIGEDVKMETDSSIDFGKIAGTVSVGGNQVIIEGYTNWKVKEWVSIANGTYVYPDGTKPGATKLKAMQKENPIQVKAN